ncbi:fibroblast growth factor receptor 2-like isoform X2 [Watersipora subatra]|uniref:fibroblast growth factor receptor 2-like isoform X2 n=1 Tax=Watersipora subatra TaxID=2589382 RepID=UPI00355B1968
MDVLSVFTLLYISLTAAHPLLHRNVRQLNTSPLGESRPPNGPRIRGNSFELISLMEGEDLGLLPCEVSNRGEAFLHWFKDGLRIDSRNASFSNGHYWLHDQRYQVVKAGLKVKNVKKAAEGRYTCELSGADGLIQEKTIMVDVEDTPPDVFSKVGALRWVESESQLDDQQTITVLVGEEFTFRCEVYGEPEIKAYWSVDDVPQNFPNSPSTYDREKMRIKFPSRSDERRTTLTWKDAQLSEQQKTFSCLFVQTLSNGTQTNFTKSFYLDVKEDGVIPPTIINDNLKPLVAYKGENYTYDCRILKPEEQNRLVYYIWGRYQGVDVNNALNLTDWKPGSTLELINVTEADEGEYVCFVTNMKSRDYRVFNLTVTERYKNSDSGEQQHEVETPTDGGLYVIIAAIVATVFVTFVVSGVIIWLKKRKPVKHAKKRIILLAPTETYHDFMKDSSSDLVEPLMPPMVQIQGGRNRLSSEICSYSDYEFPLDEKWEIRPRNRVQMMHLLGEGAFGCVYYAELKPPASEDSSLVTPIAVKMLKADATDKELIDLVQELEVMKRFGLHKNIINLVGCMTRDGPLYVIVEYAEHGNLRDFLRSHRPAYSYGSRILNNQQYNDLQLTQRHLVTFAYQVADGMNYLASQQCLHRDLAARNVLVGDNYEMKIADFGLSRNLVQSDYYKKVTEGKLPIKWMAPEALIDRKYTTKSDVWSYGVLLWEIFTLGGNPYPTVPHERLFEVLQEGHRMDRPTYSTMDMYAIMRQCWQYHSAQRPTFAEIFEDLREVVKKTGDDILDVDPSPVTTPRESTTSPRTSTTSFSCDEPTTPVLSPLPPMLPTLPAGIMV